MREGNSPQVPPGSPVAGIVSSKDRCFLAHVISPESDRSSIHALGDNEVTWALTCHPRVSPVPPYSCYPLSALIAIFWECKHGVLGSWKGVLFLICTLWELNHTLSGSFSFDGGIPEWHIHSLCWDLSLHLCTPVDFRTAQPHCTATWRQQRGQIWPCTQLITKLGPEPKRSGCEVRSWPQISN